MNMYEVTRIFVQCGFGYTAFGACVFKRPCVKRQVREVPETFTAIRGHHFVAAALLIMSMTR